MANLQEFSLIKNQVELINKDMGFDEVSYAFIYSFLEDLYPDIEVEDQITDGGGDNSIDAYYIDAEKIEINIFQFKYTSKFDNSKNKDGFSDKDVLDFLSKLERVWDKDELLLDEVNQKTATAIKDIWSFIEKGGVKTNLWLVSNYRNTITGKSKIAHYEKKSEEKFRAKLNIRNLDDIANLSVNKEFQPISIKLQFKGRNYFEETAGSVRAFIGEINAENLIKAICIENTDEINEDVFDENVRLYLKKHTKINKGIYESIERGENYKFFFYNNGITAICDSYTHPNTDGPLVSLDNFQIVNGSQTLHTLFEAYKNGLERSVKNIYLLLRIYEVKEREIGQSIARYTNTQNPVRGRDIQSNDEVQIKLQKDLLTQGYFYERKKFEHREKGSIDKKIDAEKLGQMLLSFYLEKPGSAKNKKKEVFGDFYTEIFSPEKITAEYSLLPYILSKEIDKIIKDFRREVDRLYKEGEDVEANNLQSNDEYLNYAQYYILYTLKLLAEKNDLELKIENIKQIKSFIPEAQEIVKRLSKEKEINTGLTLPYIFKSDDFTKEIMSEIKK